MAIRVSSETDAARVLGEAEAFLTSEPVRHNLILTLLQARAAHPEPGRTWVASDGGRVVGVALQSTPSRPVQVTPMPHDAVPAMADAIFESARSIPGVLGEAAVAAQFAGCWTERSKSPAFPTHGMRLYEVDVVPRVRAVDGRHRGARADERDLLLAWVLAFRAEIGEPEIDAAQVVDQRMGAGQLFVWEVGQPVSMAAHTSPVAGVVRLQYVYTPPEKRARGYAQACVGELSRQMRARAHRCMLFADLGNPLSNAMYRHLGYRAVAEFLKYRFD